jgi:hypothetical protein
MTLRALSLVAVCLALGRCACPGQPPPGGDGSVQVQVNACGSDGVTGCLVDFGTVALDTLQTREVLIRNLPISSGPLELGRLQFADVQAGGFAFHEAPATTLLPGEARRVRISLNSTTKAMHSAHLVIPSNATNHSPGGLVSVALTGTTGGTPNISFAPAACDFGAVAIDSTTYCAVRLQNETRPGVVSERADILYADFSPGTAAEFLPPVFPVPWEVPEGSQTFIEIAFHPTAPGKFSGSLRLGTSDPAHSMVEVALTGEADGSPTAIPVVEGASYPRSIVYVEPLVDVVVSGAGSVPTPQISEYSWEWVTKPAGSMAELTTPHGVTTGFTFNSGGTTHTGVDVEGTYVMHLAATDANGVTSSNLADFTLIAAYQPRFSAVLLWDPLDVDLDLHLVRGNGARFTGEDCYQDSCMTSGYALHWGASHPHLAASGEGYPRQERVEMVPLPGTYSLGVHWFSGTEANVPVRLLGLFGHRASGRVRKSPHGMRPVLGRARGDPGFK